MRIYINSFFSPWTAALFMAGLVLFLGGSANLYIWALCLFSLPVAFALLGGRKVVPVLAWIVALYWLSILGDVIAAEISGQPLTHGYLGALQERAIVFSLAAMLAMAWGMWGGNRWGLRRFSKPRPDAAFSEGANPNGIALNRALLGYAASFGVAAVGNFLTSIIPVLAQAFVGLSFVKWIFIYIIAAHVFNTGKGRHWLLLIALFEIATGAISYFSSYKESIFIMILALASTRRKVPLAYAFVSLIMIALIVWMSLIWSGAKNEYRSIIGSLTTEQKIDWIVQRYTAKDVDYAKASLLLAGRIGYTQFFTAILSREESGALPRGDNYYLSAIEYPLMPRVLFPDKPVLDDTSITERLTGIYIGRKTSAGVGYTAQAYVDFGFPLMLFPLWVIGIFLGLMCRYFLTREAPTVVRYAFATATMFQLFAYPDHIDKEVSAMVIYFIEMGLMINLCYPVIGPWLTNGTAPRGRQDMRIYGSGLADS